MENNTVGSRLVMIREHKDISLSARKMALKLKIDPSQYLKIEKGQLNLTNDKFEELSSIFNINVAWLLTGKGPMFTKHSSDLYQPTVVDT